MSQPFPSEWKDTPGRRKQWDRMQQNEAFLRRQEMNGPLTCRYCQRQPPRIHTWQESARMSHYDRLASDQATADHIIARAKGGSDHDSNLAVACFKCNYNKGDK